MSREWTKQFPHAPDCAFSRSECACHVRRIEELEAELSLYRHQFGEAAQKLNEVPPEIAARTGGPAREVVGRSHRPTGFETATQRIVRANGSSRSGTGGGARRNRAHARATKKLRIKRRMNSGEFKRQTFVPIAIVVVLIVLMVAFAILAK